MNKALVVVDMQNDFVTGSLENKEAQAIVPGIATMIKNLNTNDSLIFTRDTHEGDYLETFEGQKLPVIHCIKGTYGHQIVRDLLGYRDACIVNKNTFGSSKLVHIIKVQAKQCKIDEFEIHLVGTCTDICVVSNALMLRMNFPNTRIVVHKDLCAGTSVEAHEAAMVVMQSCQIDVVEGE